MALCLAESLVEKKGFDPEDQMQRYVRWWKEGHFSRTGKCFDIGNADRDELSALFACEMTVGLTNEDEVPPTPEKATSRTGDLWKLGRHLLHCGDASNEEHVARLMAGQKADIVFTDPPYNINYSGRGKQTSNTIKYDKLDVLEFQKLLAAAFKSYGSHLESICGLSVPAVFPSQSSN
jgi:hypothetical protein